MDQIAADPRAHLYATAVATALLSVTSPHFSQKPQAVKDVEAIIRHMQMSYSSCHTIEKCRDRADTRRSVATSMSYPLALVII